MFLQALDSLPVLLVGAGLGVVGFCPLLGCVVLVCRSRVRPSIARGLVAVAVSYVFLMAVVASAWAFARPLFGTLVVGILIGFFASWAYLAVRATRRRF